MRSGWQLTAAQRALLMGPDKESVNTKQQRLLSMAEMEEMTRRTLEAK